MPTILPGEMTRRLREFKAPTFGYRRAADGSIDKDLFDGALPDGWADSPAKVDWMEAAPPPPVAARPQDAPLAPPYEAHSIPVLSSELKRRSGKGPLPGTPKADVVAALDALDRAENPNA